MTPEGEAVHALAREAVEARARTQWRLMGARSEHEALEVFMHDVQTDKLVERHTARS